MESNGARLIAAIRDGQSAQADSDRAVAMQAYMKSTMPYRGVPTPRNRPIVAGAIAAHPLAASRVWEEVIRSLWFDASYREERYAAIGILQARRYRAFRTPEILPLLRDLIVSGAWWDLVDGIATQTVGEILVGWPSLITPEMHRWSRDANLWIRRTAILSQNHARLRTDETLLVVCIEASLAARDFFARKAIGWALREYAKVRPERVRALVDQWGERLSGLSRREALKHVGPSVE